MGLPPYYTAMMPLAQPPKYTQYPRATLPGGLDCLIAESVHLEETCAVTGQSPIIGPMFVHDGDHQYTVCTNGLATLSSNEQAQFSVMLTPPSNTARVHVELLADPVRTSRGSKLRSAKRQKCEGW